MIFRIALWTAVLCGVWGLGLMADETFARAEAQYRDQLSRNPGDWQLRLELARVILWSGRYAEAEQQFAELLAERPADPDALLGHAQAAYWWGDFRAARTRYARLLEVAPLNAEAQKAVSDLEILAEPRYDVTATHVDDSQPYAVSGARFTGSWFSDPLTRWDVRLLRGSVEGGAEAVRSGGAGFSAAMPRWRSRAEGWIESFAFPDGARAGIGMLLVDRRITPESSLFAAVHRDPLLGTAVSVDDHATATRYVVGWRRDPAARWLAAVNAFRITYSDDNRGAGADGWLVAPLFERDGFLLRGGVSAAWRDTKLNRFRFTTFESDPIDSGQWRYTYSGVYDPYWTPHDMREARLIVVAEWSRLKLQADGGYARDRAIGYGPSTGTTPNPLFIFPHMQDRSYRPWRFSAELRWPLGGSVELRTRYAHDVTVFYRANEFEASLGGRL